MPSCKHLFRGGQDVEPVYCGKTATKRVIGVVGLPPNPEEFDVCGTHALFWFRRGYTTLPLIGERPL